ncbi:MAG: class I SAM-dependent methyltransferase [Candidatus Acidiferrales bacterium]
MRDEAQLAATFYIEGRAGSNQATVIGHQQPVRRLDKCCRFCGARLREPFLDLGMSPLANSYLTADQLNQLECFYPLRVYVCSSCLLVQLEEFESPENIFSNYAYLSSYSNSWLEHARRYVEMASERFGLTPEKKVVEIASNDGYLLQYFVQKGIPVLGVEPAANIAKIAQQKGIPTVCMFFGEMTAQQLKAQGHRADLLVGNNVLAHVPELNDFVSGLKILLKPHGVVTMEFPHLLKLMAENQFDTIYHEHFSYFSLTAVERVFSAHGLAIFDADELPTHGGSLRIYARHADESDPPLASRLGDIRVREGAAGLTQPQTYWSFAENVRETKRKVLEFLISAKRAGKSIVGYGAPAKGNTLLNYCGVRSDFLDYTVDRSLEKQGHFLPGTHIPIFSPEKISGTKPEYVFILPWNIKEEVMESTKCIRKWGGQFVVPIPELRLFP